MNVLLPSILWMMFMLAFWIGSDKSAMNWQLSGVKMFVHNVSGGIPR